MIKSLIAIKSCQKNTAKRRGQRETWINEVYPLCDYKFFIGGPEPEPQHAVEDVIWLPVGDGYSELTLKTRAIAQYGWQHGFTHIFICDDDTYVRPYKLLESTFYKYPYVGWFYPIGPQNLPAVLKSGAYHFSSEFPDLTRVIFAAGDSGYWLDRRMMYFVSHFPTPSQPSSGDDMLTGMIASYRNVQLHHDDRYVPEKLPEADSRTFPPEDTSITLGGRSPDQMRSLYLKDHGETD